MHEICSKILGISFEKKQFVHYIESIVSGKLEKKQPKI